ncbi:MAG TPA: type IV pilus assembly protein PilM [Acidimicrobiia bacterium]|nr:type IV pilus assembly protein PilM [Acidimicrobiia bacterium]
MAEHVLGLDVGTSGVRVVEVCVDPKHSHGGGDNPTVRIFGQVALPAGAAREGEVVDPSAVGQAIAELWKQTGLRSKDVRVGLASQRVFVRTVELPDMPEDELAGAIRFSAQDHIPIPLDEAVFDFTVLERFVPEGNHDGTQMVRVLVAAAHREPVERLVQAVEAAGLRTLGVDLVPFALVRALAADIALTHRPGPEPAGEDDAAEAIAGAGDAPVRPSAGAIVSVGAGVTTVVVHENGIPQFVRTVALGGHSVTAAIADELGVTAEAAEAAKCSSNGDDELAARAARVVETRVAAILGEIQGSLSYWMAQSDRSIERVVLTGGGSLAGNLAGRLSTLFGVPVEVARPRDRLDVEVEDLGEECDPFLPVAAGLALGGSRGDTRSRIDLNPSKPRAPMFSRRLLVGFGAAAGAVAVVLGGLTGLALHGASTDRGRLSAQQAENAALQSKIAGFSGLRQASMQLEARRALTQTALVGDLAWTRVLEEVAHGLPEGVWLSAFSATRASTGPGPATAPAAAAAGAATPASGTATFTATGLSFPAVADWLDRLPEQAPFDSLSVGSMTKTELGDKSVVNFSSTAILTPAAGSDRAARLQEPKL